MAVPNLANESQSELVRGTSLYELKRRWTDPRWVEVLEHFSEFDPFPVAAR